MLMVDEEDCGLRSLLHLCKVAQVHEGTFREEGEVCVTQPHVEARTGLIEEARELVEGLGATEAGLGVKHEFATGLSDHATQH